VLFLVRCKIIRTTASSQLLWEKLIFSQKSVW